MLSCVRFFATLGTGAVHGIFRQEYWSDLPFPSPGIFPTHGSNPCLASLALSGRFFTTSATWEALEDQDSTHFSFLRWRRPSQLHMCRKAKLLQSYSSLCDPMDCGLPGSSVHGISQARILEWVAISFCRRSSLTQGLNLGLLCFLH